MNDLAKRFDLSGKVALVTGGAGLLGVQHCSALAAIGATVVVADINAGAAKQVAKKLCRIYGTGRAVAVVMDVSSSASVSDASGTLIQHFGGIHVLVNNAAIDPKVKQEEAPLGDLRLESMPVAQWNAEIAIGLTGAFLCSQILGTWMAANGGGVILNIASDLSVIAPDQRLYRKEGLPENLQPVKPVTYSVIKTGLIGLTRYLATYWADRNVRVNALSPGGVYVDQPPEFVSRISALIPMGRMAKVDEYISAIQFLCSDASGYMTGQNIVIDGGRSAW